MMRTRRDVLKHGLAALVPTGLLQQDDPAAERQTRQEDVPVGRLRDPGLAGQPRGPVTDYENDPFIIGVEEKLRCTCGCNLDVYTCRTTDFTCQVSPAMHRRVISLVEQNKSAQEILDAFVAEHGEMVLMAPRKEGFNIVGYVLPGFAITVVGGCMVWILARRAKLRAVASSQVGSGTPIDGLSTEEAARLEAELRDLE